MSRRYGQEFRPKRSRSRKDQRGACECKSRDGEPKVLFSQRFLASKRAGDTMGAEGKMWQVYKCPSGGNGFHITTARFDPWKKSTSASRGAES